MTGRCKNGVSTGGYCLRCISLEVRYRLGHSASGMYPWRQKVSIGSTPRRGCGDSFGFVLEFSTSLCPDLFKFNIDGRGSIVAIANKSVPQSTTTHVQIMHGDDQEKREKMEVRFWVAK